jgi:hypothetical protein
MLDLLRIMSANRNDTKVLGSAHLSAALWILICLWSSPTRALPVSLGQESGAPSRRIYSCSRSHVSHIVGYLSSAIFPRWPDRPYQWSTVRIVRDTPWNSAALISMRRRANRLSRCDSMNFRAQ